MISDQLTPARSSCGRPVTELFLDFISSTQLISIKNYLKNIFRIIKMTFLESPRPVDSPRYQVFLLTPSELKVRTI